MQTASTQIGERMGSSQELSELKTEFTAAIQQQMKDHIKSQSGVIEC